MMFRFLISMGFLAFFVAPYAEAQFSRDGSATTSLDADTAFTENGIYTLSGQVDVRQGDARVLADRMQIYFADETSNSVGSADDISRIIATNNFYYITPNQEVRGDRGVYEKKDNSFTITGDVILLQGDGNIVTGDRLIYNLETNEARFVSSCKGRRCGSGERVNIIIQNNPN